MSTRVTLAVMLTVNVIIVGYAVLAGLHADIGSYLTLVGPIITVMVSILVVGENLAKSAAANEEQTATLNDNTAKLDAIGKQVNGKMDGQFTEVHKRLDNLDKAIEPAIPVVVEALRTKGNETTK